jgi:hypothetical protein
MLTRANVGLGKLSVMALQTVAFVIVLRLAGLARSPDAADVAIVVLRHQLMVLRWQVAPRAARSRDRRVPAALAKLLPREPWPSFWSRRRRCCAGTASCPAGADRPRGILPTGSYSGR